MPVHIREHSCKTLERDMLGTAVRSVLAEAPSFAEARKIADSEAAKLSPDPFLLAWYDRKSGEFSPRVECCDDRRPGWLVYAQTRGGDIVVDVNDLEYVFLYRP